ncbi:MAG: hypothetical protein OIF32_09680, partial [Campylobacterales bacterium]|nr:hypothetical protein [Campylobacterales bacterium]
SLGQDGSEISQGVECLVGAPYPTNVSEEKYYFYSKDIMVAVKRQPKSIILQKFDIENMSLEKKMVHEFDMKSYSIEKFLTLDGRLFMFYSRWKKKEEIDELFCQEIDVENCSLSGNEVKIIEVKGELSGRLESTGFYRFRKTDKYRFDKSFDENNLVISYVKVSDIKRASKSFLEVGLNVFDKKLEPIWSEEVKMPYSEKKMKLKDLTIDKNGVVYIGALVNCEGEEAKKKKKNKEPQYDLEVLVYQDGVKKKVPFKLKEKFLKEFFLYENPRGYVLGVIFHRNNDYIEEVEGLSLFKLSLEGELIWEKDYDIPLELLNTFASKKEVKKNQKEEEKGGASFKDLFFSRLDVFE